MNTVYFVISERVVRSSYGVTSDRKVVREEFRAEGDARARYDALKQDGDVAEVALNEWTARTVPADRINAAYRLAADGRRESTVARERRDVVVANRGGYGYQIVSRGEWATI